MMLRNPYSCDPGGIQTPNLLIRSQMLYSVELRGHKYGCKYNNFPKINYTFAPLFFEIEKSFGVK